MPNYSFDHVHFISNDPLKTAEFYEKLFGARRTGTQKFPDGRTLVELDLDGSGIKVMHPRATPLSPLAPMTACGLNHVGLRTDDLEAAVDELKANGAEFVMEITEGLPGIKMAFCITPENVLLELLKKSD